MNGIITFITSTFTGDWQDAWDGIKSIFSGIWSSLSSLIKAPLNGVIGVLQGLVNSVIDGWNIIKEAINSLHFTVPDWIPGLGGKEFGFHLSKSEHITIPRLASGGFPPEDGWFRASKGEYFGQFDDGTSYIANNNQIEAGMAAGIEQAAYRGFMKALAEAGGNNTNVNIKIEGDRDKIFKVTREEARNFKARTGRPAFS